MVLRKSRATKRAFIVEAGHTSDIIDDTELPIKHVHNVASSSDQNVHKKKKDSENICVKNINYRNKSRKTGRNDLSFCTNTDHISLGELCTGVSSERLDENIVECANEVAPVMLDKDTNKNIKGGQACHQKKRKRLIESYVDFGDKNFECIYCNALFWLKERLTGKSTTNQPLFSLCCQGGKIKLPPTKSTPLFLDNLLDPGKGRKSLSFRENIRAYNSIFAFTSMGTKVDNSINF